MARNRRTTRGSGERRKKIWARQLNLNAAIAAGAGEHFNGDLLSPLRSQLGIAANLPGMTVIRIRGTVDLVETAAQSRVVIMGIRKYTRMAGDAGAALLDVEGPGQDPHADWMAFTTMTAGADQTQLEPREFDVRSMRKLGEVSESLVISFQALDNLAASIRYSVSVLLALP